MPDKGGDNVKNKQICPYCGKAIEKSLFELSTKSMINHISKGVRSNYLQLLSCTYCKRKFANKTLMKVKNIYFNVFVILVFFIIVCVYINDSNSSFLDNHILIGLTIIYIIILGVVSTIITHYHSEIQMYTPYDKEGLLMIRKPMLSSQITFLPSFPAKQLKKEFVKDNILQISANGESEYIILTKADFETGKCEATFPVLKKENGLALLEKYSEFELSNGEEVLGTLKVEKVFDA